jgi:NADPH2:quinone reductase
VKAAVYYETGPPGVLRYEDVPDPTPGPADVLIRVEAISIEGGDTLNRAGGEMPATPHVVGYQCAGTIEAVGADVSDRAPGQRVVATMPWGSHAELAVTPAVVTWLVPEGADIVSAACVPVAFGTAHDCLHEFGRLAEGETLLVQAAAGGVGVALVQLAKRAGATVIGTASSEARLDAVRPLGLDVAVDYSQDGWPQRVREATGGRGVDLAVDSVGGHVLQGSLACLAYRGRCVTVGQAGREGKLLDVSPLGMGNQSLTGVFLGAEIFLPRARQMIADLVDDVAADRLRVLVDRSWPLSQAAEAHAYIESRRAVGRVVLTP